MGGQLQFGKLLFGLEQADTCNTRLQGKPGNGGKQTCYRLDQCFSKLRMRRKSQLDLWWTASFGLRSLYSVLTTRSKRPSPLSPGSLCTSEPHLSLPPESPPDCLSLLSHPLLARLAPSMSLLGTQHNFLLHSLEGGVTSPILFSSTLSPSPPLPTQCWLPNNHSINIYWMN